MLKILELIDITNLKDTQLNSDYFSTFFFSYIQLNPLIGNHILGCA